METRYTVRQAVEMTGVKSYVLRYWEEELELQIHKMCIRDRHTGGTVTEFSDGRCDKSNDDQWYTEVDQLTKDVFQSYNNIQDSHSNGIGVGTA